MLHTRAGIRRVASCSLAKPAHHGRRAYPWAGSGVRCDVEPRQTTCGLCESTDQRQYKQSAARRCVALWAKPTRFAGARPPSPPAAVTPGARRSGGYRRVRTALPIDPGSTAGRC